MFTHTVIYEIDYADSESPSVNKVDAMVFLHPFTNKKTYILNYISEDEDDNTSVSYYEEEFEEHDMFLTEKEANDYLIKDNCDQSYFETKCFEFLDLCNKYHRRNPFIIIGKNAISKINEHLIDKTADPILKCYLQSELDYGYGVSELENKLLNEINKE